MPLPKTGMTADEVIEHMAAMRDEDVDWRNGRAFSMIYVAGDEAHDVIERASAMFAADNALNVEAFPSLRRMQSELIEGVGDLLNGGGTSAGFMTSGGTESILMACKVARDWAREERGIDQPEMILPMSAHAAFAKASHYFGIKSVRVPVGHDYRADLDAVADAITPNTAMIVGSAPQYPQGVVDPIPELAAMAAERGILCHVDACMGGFVLPFLERLGRFAKPWDFRVEGVTSISADLHKYGYAAKGASVITYRTRELRRYQAFVFDGWLGGFYGSPGVAGTRPAAPIAAAWAVVHAIGVDGYLELVRASHDAALALRAGVEATDGIDVVGDPEVTLLAMTAEDPEALDVFALGDALRAKGGWFLDRQTPPDSLHATVNAVHERVMPEFVADLQACVADLGATRKDDRDTTYGTVE